MHIEFDFESYEPTQQDIEAIRGLISMSPNTNTETPSERYEIVGDVIETDNVIDPSKKKQENDHDKDVEKKPDLTIN